MGLINLKIKKDGSLLKYVKLIRDFDGSLSIGSIKKQIENDGYVLSVDFEHYDFLDDINNVDKKEVFRTLLSRLSDLGAVITVYKDEEVISLELLDNWFTMLNEIQIEIEDDIDRELSET